MATTATGDNLQQLLDAHRAASSVWQHERTEESRLAMRAHWEVHITCPGSRLDGTATREQFTRCTPTVLSRDTRDRDSDAGDLLYRGACLHCGWVSASVHGRRDDGQGENGAAEDANDHAYPGWRQLPIVKPVPYNDGAAAYAKAVASWRKRWEPLLPAGWLDQGGPIRTLRQQCGTRHVPDRAPGGGYDMSAGIEGEQTAEIPGGQLALFG
jgi:hypothetical protein